jgi:hypothetical protein
MTEQLKNPSAFLCTGRREFVVCARLNGYTVVMLTKPEHVDIIGCDRVALHIDVFSDPVKHSVQVGVRGAATVTDAGDPGADIDLSSAPIVLEALKDQFYGDKIDDLVMAFIEEAGGAEEIHKYLRLTGRDDSIEALFKALLGGN